ncbi:PREDICTED: sugar transporter ERD6-like 3 [Tarenaya hassleriana]|uniref:sugar transporter ERD6-like 3 n=1 Tax=Tarenaya hassleriana TaxID=28532 RepID=UPI00053C4A9D|nr:PREDICTED: sugar transporter ERD6-like 3 [Tarenaya hassleriana]
MGKKMEEGMEEKPLLEREAKGNQNDDGECRITSAVVLSTLVSVFGSFCSGCSVGYSSASQSGIMRDLKFSIADYSVFGSIMTFGGIIGAVFSGKVADLLGRKNAMWFSEIFCIMGWLTIAFAEESWWLDAGRLSLGIGTGIFSYVIPIYIAEITPKHVRGAFVFANQLLQNCGLSFAYIVGNVIEWRKLAILCSVPCVLQVAGLFFIPESPRWLAKSDDEKDFKSALQRLRGQETDISREVKAIQEMVEASEQGPKSGILDLFQRRYIHAVIVGIGLMLLQQLSGSTGVTYYASSILERASFPSSIGTMILAIVMLPKSLMGLMLVDKMGRRPLLMVRLTNKFSASAMFLFSLLLSFSFTLQNFHLLEELTPIFTFIGVLGSIVTFAIGMGGLPWIIMSEIFPINLKVSAGSLVTFTNWSTGWIIAYSFNFLLEWNTAGTFLIFAFVTAVAVLFVWALVPETKGRTLEEIQASFTNFLQ